MNRKKNVDHGYFEYHNRIHACRLRDYWTKIKPLYGSLTTIEAVGKSTLRINQNEAFGSPWRFLAPKEEIQCEGVKIKLLIYVFNEQRWKFG